jgi:TP901 family phage tail tape measure protein
VSEASLEIILRARDEASKSIEQTGLSVGGLAKAALATAAVVGIAAVGMGAEAVKLATAFQYTTETLVTGAGEDQKSLAMVRQGILDLAGQVGQTPQKLAEGLYLIESAGYHGAAGLEVLKASAMGATVGAADMASVSDALTSALNAYRLPATDAAHITDVLLTTVAQGKMHLSDLAANIGKVLPIASAAHVPITQLTAAIATMTAQGTDAAMATTALRFLITNLVSPSKEAADMMATMGLSAKQLYNDLSSKGLTGALQDIQTHLASKFPVGSQQYIAAMDKMVGGTRGMTAALELTGPNMATFVANADKIGRASDGAGKTMEGWQEHSHDFSIVMERVKAGLEAVLITIGNQLLPVLTSMGLWFVANLPTIQRFADETIPKVKTAFQDASNVIQAIRGHMDVLLPIVSGLAAAWLAWQVTIIASNVQLAINAALAGGGGLAAFLVRVIAVTAAMGPLAAAQALWNLMLSLNPIGLIIIAIGIFIGLVVLALTHTKEIGQAWGWLQGQAKAVWTAIVSDVSDMVNGVIGFLTGLWNQARGVWNAVTSDVNSFIANVVGFLTGLLNDITGIWTNLTTSVENAWSQFSSRPIYWIVYLAATALVFLLGLYTSVVTWAGQMVQAAIDMGAGFVQNAIIWLGQLPGRVMTWLVNTLVQVGAWELQMIAAAVNMGTSFVTSAASFISALPGRIMAWLGSTLVQVGVWELQMIAAAISTGTSFVNNMVSFIQGLPGHVGSALTGAFNSALSFVGRMASAGSSLGQSLVNAVMAALASLPGRVASLIQGVAINAGSQITQALHNAHVPGFASGAVVTHGYGGVVARIGEGAEDEVVATASQMAAVGMTLAGGGGGAQTIIVPVQIDGKTIAQVVAEYNGKKFNLQGGRYGSGA